MPGVTVDAKDYLLLVPSLTNLPAADLHRSVGNVGASREAIIAALDYLFVGV